MESLSPWQTVMPDSLLIEIFGHLDIRTLGKATQACMLWRRIALDDILWRNLARKCFKIQGKLSRSDCSWKDEVRRLVYHVPKVESEQYEVHQDEVLDVAISHNGQYFCTTSKDRHAMLWMLGYPSWIISDVDLGSLLSWELTQYSSFNDSDTLVFVCGVSLPSTANIQSGRGAVFTVPDMKLVCAIELDPPTLFGSWLTDRMFVGGRLSDLQDLIKIESYKISDEELEAAHCRQNTDTDIFVSTLNKEATTVFTFLGHQYHQMNLLVATFPKVDKMDNTGCLRWFDNDQTCSLMNNSEVSCTSEPVRITNSLDLDERDAVRTSKLLGNRSNHDQSLDPENVKDKDVSSNSNIGADGGIGEVTEVDETEKKSKLLNDELGFGSKRTVCNSGLGSDDERLEKAVSCDRCVSCDIETDTSTEHRSSNEWTDLNSCDRTELSIDQEAMDTSCVKQKFMLKQGYLTYILFVTGGHDAIAVHEITEDTLSRADDLRAEAEADAAEDIDHYFHIKDCYITGLSLSHDQRFLLFNYREFDPNEPINKQPGVPLSEKISSQHLRVGTIDLATMTRLTDKEYAGHIAFSEYPAWYICLDASPSFVGSGSEDGKAYLWDRHHQVLLNTLQHQEGVVNGIAFSPVDQETCITVCDDRLIKIWRSKNRLKDVSQWC